MPELPEVETVRRGLVPHIKGKRIKRVELRRANLRTPFPSHFTDSLEGAQITDLRRRAKYILADLDNGMVLLIHLGMSGSFGSYTEGTTYTPAAHDHVILHFEDGLRLAYNDPRRFGQMDVFPAAGEAAHRALSALGPEPLEDGFTGDVLAARLQGRKVEIKQALLDQSVVAGVGNIYACEALFYAGIDPRKSAEKITRQNCDKLASAIRQVLEDAVAVGGSTLRDHKQINGQSGYFQHSFAVYGRKGEACAHKACGCGTPIRAIMQGGRTTFFCTVKQR